MSIESEIFWDFLCTTEAGSSDEAMRELEPLTWAQPPLVRALQTKGGLTRNNMGLLFELRFTRALHRAGVIPQYEITGEADSTLDFGFTFNGHDFDWTPDAAAHLRLA